MEEKIFLQSEIQDMTSCVHEALEGRYSLTGEDLMNIESMLIELDELRDSLCYEPTEKYRNV